MKIIGIENLDSQQLNFELQHGARFVQYLYCVSVIVITFRRGTDVYFVRAGEGNVAKGLGWTALSLVLGWWGIPWGPIYTIHAVGVNFRGGKDLTAEVVNAMSRNATGTSA